jgi:hypothetical protein
MSSPFDGIVNENLLLNFASTFQSPEARPLLLWSPDRYSIENVHAET